MELYYNKWEEQFAKKLRDAAVHCICTVKFQILLYERSISN